RRAAPRGRPARHLPLGRGNGPPADALRARPRPPDGPARPPRPLRAGAIAAGHGAAAAPDAGRGGRRRRRRARAMRLTLFDLDGTLLPRDSDHAFGEFIVTLGWADGDDFRRRNDAFYDDYLAGRLDIDAYVDFATAPWRDRPEPDLAWATARF